MSKIVREWCQRHGHQDFFLDTEFDSLHCPLCFPDHEDNPVNAPEPAKKSPTWKVVEVIAHDVRKPLRARQAKAIGEYSYMSFFVDGPDVLNWPAACEQCERYEDLTFEQRYTILNEVSEVIRSLGLEGGSPIFIVCAFR